MYIGQDIEAHAWPGVRRVQQMWYASRGDAPAPSRKTLMVRVIASELPFMSIFDVTWDPFILTCRLMGTAFEEAIGEDLTGQIFGADGSLGGFNARARWICENFEPLLIKKLPLIWSPKKNYTIYDTIGFPFLDENGQVNSLLYVNKFYPE